MEELFTNTASYVDDINSLSKHYEVPDRLLEMIIEEFVFQKLWDDYHDINMDLMIKRINTVYPEIYYDENDKTIQGPAENKRRSIELSDRLYRKSRPLMTLISKYGPIPGRPLVLKNIKTSSELMVSLLEGLKILKRYQPDIEARFKGLGSNNANDIKSTVMDPDTRTLIRVQISDIINDAKTFGMLLGTSLEERRARAKLVSNYIITPEMIDS